MKEHPFQSGALDGTYHFTRRKRCWRCFRVMEEARTYTIEVPINKTLQPGESIEVATPIILSDQLEIDGGE
jgi:hypothetical protein